MEILDQRTKSGTKKPTLVEKKQLEADAKAAKGTVAVQQGLGITHFPTFPIFYLPSL